MAPQILISDFHDVIVPPLELPHGMISQSERRFLYWLASKKHSGVGELIEIGTWLGCSTIHLAAGLRDGSTQDKVNAFDDYVWRPGMGEKSGLEIAEGDSFFPNFINNIAALRAQIEPRVASANDLEWKGGKIETLVIDAPKSWRTIRRVFKQLAPQFIRGKTRIALQDYLHLPSYELALYIASLDALEPEAIVLDGSTVQFRVTGKIPEDHLSDDFNYKLFDAAEINRLWGKILGMLPPAAYQILAPAHPMTLWQLGHHAEAEACLAKLKVTNTMVKFVLKKTGKKSDPHFVWLREAIEARKPAEKSPKPAAT